jgi:YidC/Oxa1 family membrane protein insertase
MSYFLIIRWDPPSDIQVIKDVKSEVSTYSQSEDFGFIDESIKNESEELITNSVSTTCVSGGDYEIDSNNWKISVDLMDGSFKKAELKKYPDEIGSNNNKLMFDACGRNEYSQLSGFVFGNNVNQDFSSFKIEDIKRSSDTNSYTFVRESASVKESKIISFQPEDYFVKVKHVIRNLSSDVINSSSY